MVCKTCTTRFDYKKKRMMRLFGAMKERNIECVIHNVLKIICLKLICYCTGFLYKNLVEKKNQLDFTTQADISNV